MGVERRGAGGRIGRVFFKLKDLCKAAAKREKDREMDGVDVCNRDVWSDGSVCDSDWYKGRGNLAHTRDVIGKGVMAFDVLHFSCQNICFHRSYKPSLP